MSANPLELFTAYAGAAKAPESETAFSAERRRRPRICVHWPVLLFRHQVSEAITSITQDLSSSGFYCLTAAPLAVGEVLTCALKIPSYEPNGKCLDRSLDCKVRVVRVEQGPDSSFGIACHIDEYHFADIISRGMPVA